MLNRAVTSDSSQLIPLDPETPAHGSPKPLFGLDAAALSAHLAELGEPAFRGRQLAHALYSQWLDDLDAITTLPKSLRRRLRDRGFAIDRPRIVQVFHSADGTERYLIQCQTRNPAQLPDMVETVWMPDGDGGEAGEECDAGESNGSPVPSFRPLSAEGAGGPGPRPARLRNTQSSAHVSQEESPVRQSKTWDRATVCVSSQAGCAVNCQFCLTARLGLPAAAGNLNAGEIAGQVVSVLTRHGVQVGRDRVNLVFMGMGEPFLNYANFMAGVRLLVRETGLSPQRMTVSTSGIVPGIEQFALEPPDLRPRLAISLNAPNNQVRSAIMPINRKWPIESVIAAARRIPLRPRERITFEYVLLAGVTDRPEHARQVARLVRRSGLPAKLNLIAWNPGPGIPYAMPAPEAVAAFQAALAGEEIPVFLRQPRGRDIYAACGQLKRTIGNELTTA